MKRTIQLDAFFSSAIWALLVIISVTACEKEPKATGPTCPASEMVVERDNQGRLVSVVNFYGNGDSLAVRYRGDTAATVFRYAIRDSVALYERARYELNYPQGPHFSYHILPWTFNDTVEHRMRRYEMKNGRISAYTTFERYRQGNGSWQVDTFAQAHITYDSLGRMVSFSSHLPGSPLYGYGEHFIYGPQAPSYAGSFPFFAGWNPVLGIWQGQKTLPTSSIGPYYMGVYDTAHYYYRGTSRLQELEELGYNSEGETRCTKTKVIYR